MKAVNYTEFRKNLKNNLDSVYNDHEALIVTRKRNENMVVLSQEDYNSMKETIYLLSSKANATRLYDSIEQAKSGEIKTFSIEDIKEMV